MRKLLIIVIDLVIIYAAIILSFIILKNAVLLNYTYNIGAFYYISPIIIPIYIILAYVFGMIHGDRKLLSEIIYTVFIVSLALTISIMASIFFIRGSASSYPRSVVLLSFFLYFVMLTAWRWLVALIQSKMHGVRRVMVVGNTPNLLHHFNHRYKGLFALKYQFSNPDNTILDKIYEVDDIFVGTDVDDALREQIMLIYNSYPEKNVYYLPRLKDISVINSRMNRFGDVPTHQYSKMYLDAEEMVAKRIMDIVVSLFCIIVFLPIMILIAILVVLDGGPVFYTQKRLTKDRKLFTIIKFRTMIPNAEVGSGPILSEKKDGRITWIGRFLRVSRLDELPQFWNILKGDMSVVGPRPERPYFVEKIEKELPEFKYRLNVKAGLTGLAQVYGRYNTDPKQKLLYDIYYINNFSLFRDLLIMLQTINTIFWKENSEGVHKA